MTGKIAKVYNICLMSPSPSQAMQCISLLAFSCWMKISKQISCLIVFPETTSDGFSVHPLSFILNLMARGEAGKHFLNVHDDLFVYHTRALLFVLGRKNIVKT